MSTGAAERPAAESVHASPPAPVSPGLAMLGMLIWPRATVRRLPTRGTAWLLPAGVIALLLVLPSLTVLRPLELEARAELLDRYADQGWLSAEEAHDAERRLAELGQTEPAAHVVAFQLAIGLLFQIAVRFLLPAWLLLAGARFVLEAEVRYRELLSAVAFAAVPAGVRELARTPLRLARGDLDVHFSPAALAPAETFGAQALRCLDAFDLWIVGLLVLAVAATARLSYGRAAALVVPLWGAACLLRLGLSATPIGGGL